MKAAIAIIALFFLSRISLGAEALPAIDPALSSAANRAVLNVLSPELQPGLLKLNINDPQFGCEILPYASTQTSANNYLVEVTAFECYGWPLAEQRNYAVMLEKFQGGTVVKGVSQIIHSN